MLKQDDLIELMKKDPETIEGLELPENFNKKKKSVEKIRKKIDPRLLRVYQVLAKYAPPKIHSADGSEVDRRGAQGSLK